MRSVFFLLLILLNLKANSQPDFWTNLVYYSGSSINHIPKGITIPEKDSESRSIMNSIINGSSYKELNQQFPDSLDIKLSRLIKGKLIQKEEDHFKVLIPVLVGAKRSELKTMIREKVIGENEFINDLINPLTKLLSDHPEMVFHFLWSRIIDNCWWDLYNSEFKTKTGPPSLAFIVFPFHPFQCGTNFDNTTDNSQIAITWSYSLLEEFSRLPPTASFYNLVLKKPVSDKEKSFFIKHGFINSDNVSKLFVYTDGSKLDLLCDSLREKYIVKLKGLFNYQELSKAYHIPSDDLFMLMSHEIVYEFFELLHEEKKSLFIPIIRENNPDQIFSSLVSIRLLKP
jgi:hypothetical protein